MANTKKRANVVEPMTDLVNKVESEASKLLRRAEYEMINGERKKTRDGESKTVPYTFYQIDEKECGTDIDKFANAVVDLTEKCDVSLEQLTRMVNFGLEYYGRRELQSGGDPRLSPLQVKTLNVLRGALAEEMMTREDAVTVLVKKGWTQELIDENI